MVIGIQADMWDPAAITATTNELSNYTPIVQKLADLVEDFGGPVLLLNGDSHVYGSDQPLADPNQLNWKYPPHPVSAKSDPRHCARIDYGSFRMVTPDH